MQLLHCYRAASIHPSHTALSLVSDKSSTTLSTPCHKALSKQTKEAIHEPKKKATASLCTKWNHSDEEWAVKGGGQQRSLSQQRWHSVTRPCTLHVGSSHCTGTVCVHSCISYHSRHREYSIHLHGGPLHSCSIFLVSVCLDYYNTCTWSAMKTFIWKKTFFWHVK